jgi:spore coat polysaccharide biosynthesis protein SpsF
MIGVVAQARMTSARLPGKVLRPLDGRRPCLQFVVERLQRCERAGLVAVATSDHPTDDPVASLCERLGVAVHRGPLDDVAGRYLGAVDRFGLDAFVRVSADSPLIDQGLVDRGIALFEEGGTDVVTNVFPRTFPSGQSLEVVDGEAFRGAYRDMTEPTHFEHVTAFIYRDPERFRIRNFESGRDEAAIHLALDTEEDARLIEAIVARMDRPHWEYDHEAVMELYRAEVPA